MEVGKFAFFKAHIQFSYNPFSPEASGKVGLATMVSRRAGYPIKQVHIVFHTKISHQIAIIIPLHYIFTRYRYPQWEPH